MAFCGNCGAQVDDSVKFCPACGGAITASPPVQQVQQPVYQQAPPAQESVYQQQPQQAQQPVYQQQPQQAQQPVYQQQTQQAQQPYQQPGYQQPLPYRQPVVPGAPMQADIQDAQQNKTMAIFAYILFFVPLIAGAHKTSPFAKYHTNQGTILFLCCAAYTVITSIICALVRTPLRVMGVWTGIYTTPIWLLTLVWICGLVFLVPFIMGIYNAATGKMQPLPVIGKYTIIK